MILGTEIALLALPTLSYPFDIVGEKDNVTRLSVTRKQLQKLIERNAVVVYGHHSTKKTVVKTVRLSGTFLVLLEDLNMQAGWHGGTKYTYRETEIVNQPYTVMRALGERMSRGGATEGFERWDDEEGFKPGRFNPDKIVPLVPHESMLEAAGFTAAR